MQALTERFEMRLDQDTLRDVDAWRSGEDGVPSRAEAIRRLIELGLSSATVPEKRQLRFSPGETLSIHMLCDLFKALKIKSGLDPKFIESAMTGGHLWGLEWDYTGVFHHHEDKPAVVSEVVDVLDMWDLIESTYESFGSKAKQRIEKEAEPFGRDPKFHGFDGNNEEHYSVARFLVEDMKRFSRFKGRELNSHSPSIDGYRRMLEVFLPMRATLMGTNLSDTQIIEILNARAHPDYRKGKSAPK